MQCADTLELHARLFGKSAQQDRATRPSSGSCSGRDAAAPQRLRSGGPGRVSGGSPAPACRWTRLPSRSRGLPARTLAVVLARRWRRALAVTLAWAGRRGRGGRRPAAGARTGWRPGWCREAGRALRSAPPAPSPLRRRLPAVGFSPACRAQLPSARVAATRAAASAADGAPRRAPAASSASSPAKNCAPSSARPSTTPAKSLARTPSSAQTGHAGGERLTGGLDVARVAVADRHGADDHEVGGAQQLQVLGVRLVADRARTAPRRPSAGRARGRSPRRCRAR